MPVLSLKKADQFIKMFLLSAKQKFDKDLQIGNNINFEEFISGLTLDIIGKIAFGIEIQKEEILFIEKDGKVVQKSIFNAIPQIFDEWLAAHRLPLNLLFKSATKYNIGADNQR